MNFLRILAASTTSAGLTDSAKNQLSGIMNTAYKTFESVIDLVIPILVSVIALFGIIYGIMIGVKFAKAEDTEQRDKAKGQLINLAIGVGVIIVITLVMYAILKGNYIESLFTKN